MSLPPEFNVSWKVSISLMLLGVRAFRPLLSKYPLKHLHRQVLVQPKAIAFLVLIQLGRGNDPEFVWHLLDLLRRVPEEMFEDKWISLALNPLDGIPGATMQERITLCQRVIKQSFSLPKVERRRLG
jgi:hypothetical protein